ncbi:unnamed protein product [Mycena citricolor]|uniref:protein-tyrosine-phosphatase n=1 Tax=Mycena citricolor TaxID=2018698 RepID=A0AAD2HPS6_9AGAR|nr:unnamed protein product [Mycena citricolor]
MTTMELDSVTSSRSTLLSSSKLMDFFAAVGDAQHVAHNLPDDTKSFAEAVAARFGQQDNMSTARLLPPPVLKVPLVSMPSVLRLAPSAPSNADQKPLDAFALTPQSLPQWINDPHTLIIDIRPHAAYSSARISRAVSLSVPSTLLKRPMFSLQRLAGMLPSNSARTQFSAWRSASRITVYDADSTSLGDTSNIRGLLRKFRAEAPEATIELAWVVGGFQAVWTTRRDLVDVVPPTPDNETEDDDAEDAPSINRTLRAHDLPRSAFALSSTTQGPRPGRGKYRWISLPERSTDLCAGPFIHNSDNPQPIMDPTDQPATLAAFNPFYDSVRQNVELSQGITERIPLRLSRRVRRRIGELPFKWLRDIAKRAAPVTPPDLALGSSMDVSFSQVRGPRLDSSEEESSDSGLSGVDRWGQPDDLEPNPQPRPTDVEEGTEALAMQFYRIELMEQRRMMGIMEHHSHESGPPNHEADQQETTTTSTEPRSKSLGSETSSEISSKESSDNNSSSSSDSLPSTSSSVPDLTSRPVRRLADDNFPFSITAGVEKGAKNRYRNIWPFEHARVKLHADGGWQGPDPPKLTSLDLLDAQPIAHDDYVNASYVQPLGTHRRYIATQGPLDATFGDFWTLVWQQNVHVIVMLTREVEGAVVKCGAYWMPGVYGSLKVELLGCGAPACTDICSSCAFDSGERPETTGFFGNMAAKTQTTEAPLLIRRTLRLTHAAYPHAPPRRVVQLQYRGWPDMNVPEETHGVLGLVGEVDKAVDEAGKSALPRNSVKHRARVESDGDDVDATAGVVNRALRDGAEGAPVLLHCSAGVGRTGGFIAIHAVLDSLRQEARSLFASGQQISPVPGHRQSSGSDTQSTSSTGPLPSEIGRLAVADSDGMEVDSENVADGRTPMQVDGVDMTLGAEVTKRWAQGVADTQPSSLPPASIFPAPETTSFRSSTSLEPLSRDSSPFLSAPRTALPLFLRRGNADRPRTFSAPSAATPVHKNVAKVLDRSLVNSPAPDSRSMSPFAPGQSSLRSFKSVENMLPTAPNVDYKEPRSLHLRGGKGPVRLSTLEEPIWEVIQDMREQRMSLCQSLRQYVFVHAAIIEGALMVIDQERARAGLRSRPAALSLSPPPRRTLNRPPRLVLLPGHLHSPSSTGKRLASPTELPKENKKGEIALSKRPSIKRKQVSGDDFPPHLFPPP